MTEDIAALFARQRDALAMLKEEAADYALAVADQAWDRFELEIEDAIGDEFLFDLADSVGMILRNTLTLAFDEAFDKHVSQRLARLEEAVQVALGGTDGFDGFMIELTALRKGIKLGRHAAQAIEAAIARTRPGLGRALGSLLDDLLDDPEQQMESLEKDMRRDAKRLKAELLKLREALVTAMCREAELLLKQAARAYSEWLDGIESRLGKAQGAAA